MRIPIFNRFTCRENQLEFMIKSINNKNMLPILDYANEDFKNFKNNFKKIKNLIKTHPNNSISIKLSSLNFREDYLRDITKSAIDNNSKILIDAENFLIQDKINNITDNLIKEFNVSEVNIYKTYQMYRNDSFDLLKKDFLKSRNYYIGCKLVRGAYLNYDKKYNILFNKINDTHSNYNKSIEFIIENLKDKDILMCATHNKESIELVTNLIDKNPGKNVEIAHLMGMSDKVSENLSNNYKVYKYLPYGNFIDTIPYLIRRLYENYPMVLNILK